MPQILPTPDPPDRPQFEEWLRLRRDTEGFRRCIADRICPFCEERTLLLIASPDGITLSCPCLES